MLKQRNVVDRRMTKGGYAEKREVDNDNTRRFIFNGCK